MRMASPGPADSGPSSNSTVSSPRNTSRNSSLSCRCQLPSSRPVPACSTVLPFTTASSALIQSGGALSGAGSDSSASSRRIFLPKLRNADDGDDLLLVVRGVRPVLVVRAHRRGVGLAIGGDVPEVIPDEGREAGRAGDVRGG